MSRFWFCVSALIATAFLFIGTTERASALCKPGTPHCTKLRQPNCVGQCYRFRVLDSNSSNTNTPSNDGDCVGKCYRFRVLDNTK